MNSLRPPEEDRQSAELDPALFRHEAGRMVVALTRLFGVHNLALAEDVVQDAFCRAIEVWKFRGVPANPSAWLMATAKHRAVDILRRERAVRSLSEFLRLVDGESVAKVRVPGRDVPRNDAPGISSSSSNSGWSQRNTNKGSAETYVFRYIVNGFSTMKPPSAMRATSASTRALDIIVNCRDRYS